MRSLGAKSPLDFEYYNTIFKKFISKIFLDMERRNILDLNFCKMTFAVYALTEKDPKTFYYITDTGDLYQGTKLLNTKMILKTEHWLSITVLSKTYLMNN